MNPRNSRINPAIGIVAAFLLLTLAGCATTTPTAPVVQKPQTELVYEDMRLVTVQPGETLESLAAKYLNDPSRAWLIADFNDIQSASEGQRVVIPPPDYRLGGIYPEGYQVVPVLTYHNFSNKKAAKMVVPRDRFEAQMKYLKDNGYQTITLDELFDFVELKAQIPPKAIVITVDDGWRPFYEIAYPILKKYNLKATLFLYTDFVGGGKAVKWEMVREMMQHGIEVQNHTKSHRNLTKIKDKETFEQYFAAVEREIDTGEEKLKKNLDISPRFLAYPYGDTNDLVVEMLKKRGYRAAFTVVRGGNPFYLDNYRLNRTVIYGDYDLKKFEANVAVRTRY